MGKLDLSLTMLVLFRLKEWNLPALFKNWRAKRLATSMPIFLDR